MSGVREATADDADLLAALAARNPIAYNDLSSVARGTASVPHVHVVPGDRALRAAALDDGLSMAVMGEPAALLTLGQHLSPAPGRIAISGLSEEVDAFVVGLGADARRPRHELLMAARMEDLRLDAAGLPGMGIATIEDHLDIARARIAAINEEHGLAISTHDADGRRIAEAARIAIDNHAVVCLRVAGSLAFTAQLAARTSVAAGISDVWVAPARRREGLATRGLSQLLSWLADTTSHVVLRVGRDNAPAVALYERLGLGTHAHCTTWLSDTHGGDAPHR